MIEDCLLIQQQFYLLEGYLDWVSLVNLPIQAKLKYKTY